uniref:Bidirectional sugar transporter SWEET n=2 Tax=Lotharella globosa TaxID=91324 RepID=A0A7S4DEL5_9EUKA|eukprot:CAMPEP_0167778666 /NCGR_PEP_ID=MMETSP0111_2-20121227/4381_1 /TAXON_ID=91324 /ORGANISM="Lotharella globosa, Strain CCCM811" /LENGTH=135 /DNA_ID=CAMNT_0007668997 /DNA_START=391 /DNA_END=798 /DNA_ORIENTATION=+
MLSSPLSQACQVVKHRSTANASWGLTISCAANSFFWAAYAHVIDDWYLLFPPLLGMVLAAMQISLLIIFSKRCLGIHPKKKEKEAVEMAPQAGKSKSSPSCKASKSAVSVPNARLGKNGNASSDKDGAQVAAELP